MTYGNKFMNNAFLINHNDNESRNPGYNNNSRAIRTSFRQRRCRGSWWIRSRRAFVGGVGAERRVERRARLWLIETKLLGQLFVVVAVYVFEYAAACHLHLSTTQQTVRKYNYNYIVVRPELSQLGWLNLPHSLTLMPQLTSNNKNCALIKPTSQSEPNYVIVSLIFDYTSFFLGPAKA